MEYQYRIYFSLGFYIDQFAFKEIYFAITIFGMTHPEIHIKISKPLPKKVQKVLSEKRERRALYAKRDIKSIREKDNKRDVSPLSKI